MNTKLRVALILAILASLLLPSVVSAAEIAPPIKKSLEGDPSRTGYAWLDAPSDAMDAAVELAAATSPGAPFGGPVPAAGRWYLLNGAFDDDWNSSTPMFWKVHAGDADSYGSFEYVNNDATGAVVDRGFAFTIINNEVTSFHNAYLYQEITLPQGDYWIDLHSSIYGHDSLGSMSYAYMTYYALVPKAVAMVDGAFTPGAISEDTWRELWLRSYACAEETKGFRWSPGACIYQKRAETVSVAGGEYVFVLRAELKWPDWQAFAHYVFDDVQIIKATPLADNWNDCDGTFCVEGWLRR